VKVTFVVMIVIDDDMQASWCYYNLEFLFISRDNDRLVNV
jgi:hypothetical protein